MRRNNYLRIALVCVTAVRDSERDSDEGTGEHWRFRRLEACCELLSRVEAGTAEWTYDTPQVAPLLCIDCDFVEQEHHHVDNDHAWFTGRVSLKN